jgi:hypothetical protein
VNEANISESTTECRTVERDGCTLVYGAIPVRSLGQFLSGSWKGAVVDTDLARMTGANFAVGTPMATRRLKDTIAAEVMARTQETYSQDCLSSDAIRWLAHGEHGESSQAMFMKLTGVELHKRGPLNKSAYPFDASDLRRCRLLLEAVPELNEWLHKMREVSPIWEALVGRWDEVCGVMDAECASWRDGIGFCPKTYELLTEVERSA